MKLTKNNNVLPYIFIIAAFGPYILPQFGLATEHFIIYPIFLLILFFTLWKDKKVIKQIFWLAILWGSMLLFLTFRSVFNDSSIYSVIAGLESVFQPLAIIITFSVVYNEFSKEQARERLIKSSKLIILLLSLNAIWAVLSMFIDLNYINAYFWGATETVATKAMGNGRYSGIFNQPMEAGVLYSLGMFCWIYLSERINVFKFKYIISLFLMVLGGLLTVSKVYLFGGLPMFFVGVLLNKRVRKLISRLFLGGLVIGVPGYVFLSNNWTGMPYLLRFVNSNQDLATLLTAGRLGSNSGLAKMSNDVLSSNPFIGNGFGAHDVYDSAFFFFFGTGGIIGLGFYILFLLALSYLAIKYILYRNFDSESKLFFAIVILIITAGLGAPVLTLNRVSLIIWTLIGLCIQFFYFAKKDFEGELMPMKKKTKRKRYKLVW